MCLKICAITLHYKRALPTTPPSRPPLPPDPKFTKPIESLVDTLHNLGQVDEKVMRSFEGCH